MEQIDTPQPADATLRSTQLAGDYSHTPRRRNLTVPLVLFLATCLSTFWTGSVDWMPAMHIGSFREAGWVLLEDLEHGETISAIGRASEVLVGDWHNGLFYMIAVMGILLTHEMGHFVMALRRKIPASLPFFIPVPILPFGTMGAVISMEGSLANRRGIFDLGIAGPLAGLAVALPITWIGIQQLGHGPQPHTGMVLHNPMIFKLLIAYLRPDLPNDSTLYMSQFNPFLMAGWVGMLVTGLNMLPISQLDGGHVSYALLGRRAHILARGLIVAAILAILIWEAYMWVMMLVLVILLGVDHPPTADDRVELGLSRRIIGYASLAIPILCLPPMRIT